MSAFDDAFRAFEILPDGLPEKQIHSVAPNLGHGNSALDTLLFWLMRETVRGLTRSLFGQELDASGVSPLNVTTGHKHDQNQEAALSWWPASESTLWFDEGAVTMGGAAAIDQTTERDIVWVPFCVPEGVDLAYFKLRCGTQTADDIGYVRVRLYDITNMNGSPVAVSGLLRLSSPDSGLSPLSDRWFEIGPLVTTALSSANGMQQGWARVSGSIAVAGDFAWVSEIVLGLRQGL